MKTFKEQAISILATTRYKIQMKFHLRMAKFPSRPDDDLMLMYACNNYGLMIKGTEIRGHFSLFLPILIEDAGLSDEEIIDHIFYDGAYIEQNPLEMRIAIIREALKAARVQCKLDKAIKPTEEAENDFIF